MRLQSQQDRKDATIDAVAEGTTDAAVADVMIDAAAEAMTESR